MKPLFASLLLICLPLSSGEDLSPLVEEALDQAVHLNIEDRPLSEAFKVVSDQTGVTVTVAPGTFGLIPYGENTRVSARMEHISLRQGLTELTAPLGLRFEVRPRGIEVLPTPALARLGRRASWQELDTLAELHRADFTADGAALERLEGRVQFRVEEAGGWALLREAIARVGAGPGDEVLASACASLGWTWYPAGDYVVVISRAAQLERQLEAPVSIRESHRKLIDVLARIADQAGVDVRYEPGAITALPPATQDNFSLHFKNISAAEAFEYISGVTGLGYRVDPDAVVFYHPDRPRPQARESRPAPARRSAGAFVGKIVLPPGPDGVHIELLIHESDLSPDVIELRRKYLERANNLIREALLELEEDRQ